MTVDLKKTHWGDGMAAAGDFRSDTITRPTLSMLSAIASATLLDDDFRQDPTTLELETWVAELTGKEAGLLVVSGTMGNQLSIRSHLQSGPHSIACDARSHIMNFEAGGIATLSGALTIPIQPANGKYLTVEDIEQRAIVVPHDHCACPTRLVCLENTLNGTIMPLSECRRIRDWAQRHDVRLHLDGARLWEAVAAGAGTLREFCECFDSISLCFSKGLGAPIGSIIVGTMAFRERARWIRKSIGGGMRQAGVVSAAARRAVVDTFLAGKLQESHEKAKQIARLWEGYGGKLVYPVETNMVWLDLDAAGVSAQTFREQGEALGLKFMMGGRLVVHYQVTQDAVQKLDALMRRLLRAACPEEWAGQAVASL
ncbi:alanine racemase [Lojkania enalia]|uniref:Alanine racemase n=1 Tax=Lojkania enalia TaxID=147567 RepID=A0A9P4MXJ2_9PLEO|nr:alanine racemase [Didymosphaeria enalia]